VYGIAVIVTKTDTAAAIRAKCAELQGKRSTVERMLHERDPGLIGKEPDQVVSRWQELEEDPTQECKIRVYLMPDVSPECAALSGDGENERIPDVSFTELRMVEGETAADYTIEKIRARAIKRLAEEAQKVWVVTGEMRIPNKLKPEFSDATLEVEG
jgi:hypothetical protein